MRKAEEWNKFFEDNHRYADLINGIGCVSNRCEASV